MQKLGKYEILAELGHGAMGVVYKAKDPFIGRLVALKTINSSLVDRPDLLERFYQEAQSAGKLQHPNIVTIFELGQEKDTPFIAMEYLSGESLEKTIVRETDMPLAVKVGYVVRICQALEYAHKNRVVHRDIKPGNVMVNAEGAVKVVDFGIARLVDFSRTHTNMMIGTPAYMAPELFRKKKADERTDIWAVGVTFYELICYQRPFTGDGYDIIRSIMEDDYAPAGSVVPECGAEVESVIRRMLTKSSTERYQSMEDVLLDLEPVWNRLRACEADALAQRGRELYELGDLLKAQDRLRRARQIDSSNTIAKSLLEKISSEIRRTEILPKVQEHLTRGRGFLQSGQLHEAQAEVEAALGLDSHYEPAQKLVSEIEAATARAQQLDQKLRLAKQRLAEGALGEAESALRQVLELNAEHPQAAELKRQIAEEQGRRERRKKLNEVLHRARSLWTELKYDECLTLLSDAQRAFPNEPELKSLQETARADQLEQKKQRHVSEVRRLLGQQKLAEARQALESLTREMPQDATVKNLQTLLAQEELEQKRKKRLADEFANLRALVSGGRLRDAVAKGEALLREFPQEYEVLDLVSYAKGEVAQQEQKKSEQEREKQIRSLLETQRFRDAADLAKRAVQEFSGSDIFRRLLADAEQKSREQQEKERIQREVHQRIQDIRGKIKRQELTDAIDLARQTLATHGPDTDVTQLLHAAELEAEERNKKREDQKQQIQAAKTMLDRGDFAAATQLLNQAITAKAIPANDIQTKLLLSQIAEKKEEAFRQEEKKRKKDEEERRKAAQKQPKAEPKELRPPGGDDRAPAGSQPTRLETFTPPKSGPPPVSAPTLSESATSIAAGGTRPKPSAPVMTPLPAVQPQATRIETKIRVQERVGDVAITPAPGGLLKKPAVLAVLGLVVVGAVAAGVYVATHRGSKPAGTSPEDLALETQAGQLWQAHRPDDALEAWKKLADHQGPLQIEAANKVSEIEHEHVDVEQQYQDGMKLLYEEKKYPEAAQKFNDVLQKNLWKMDEARKEYDIASKGPGTAPLKPLWQTLYEEGTQAFDRKDYAAALQSMQRAVQTSGISKDIASKARRQIPIIQNRLEQKKNYDTAQDLERKGDIQQAKGYYERVQKARDADGELSALARNEIKVMAAAAKAQPAANPNPNAGGSSAPPVKPTPTDYGPAVADIRGLISQGKWAEAQVKLSGLPTTVTEFNGLKSQVEAGMRDDQAYAQRYDEYFKAHTSKNKAELLAVRPFFNDESGKPGRHSAEAKTVAAQIDADVKDIDAASVKPPEVVKPAVATNASSGGTSAGGNDAAAINGIVDSFAKAYNQGDIAALRAVREYDAKDEKKMSEALKIAKTQGYSLQNCSAPQVNGDTATISCDVVLTKIPSVKPARTNIHLRNFNGRWMIVSSN